MYKYILRGKKIIPITDPVIWGQWLERADRKIKKEVVNEHVVSTVFLGLDHNFFSKGPPLLFETMIFSDDKELNTQCWRYSTYDEAEKGHDGVVAMLKSGMY